MWLARPLDVLYPISERYSKHTKGRCMVHSAAQCALELLNRRCQVKPGIQKVINNHLLKTATLYLII